MILPQSASYFNVCSPARENHPAEDFGFERTHLQLRFCHCGKNLLPCAQLAGYLFKEVFKSDDTDVSAGAVLDYGHGLALAAKDDYCFVYRGVKINKQRRSDKRSDRSGLLGVENVEYVDNPNDVRESLAIDGKA